MKVVFPIFVALMVVLVSFTGCTTSMKPTTNDASRISSVDEKNYTLGAQTTVYVGEPILSRKAYDMIVRNDYVRPSNDFSLLGGIGSVNVSLYGSTSDKFKIIATNKKGNAAVAIPGSHLAFGITAGGAWDHTIASSSFWTSPVGGGGAGYKLEPPSTRFSRVETKTPIGDAGYINHD